MKKKITLLLLSLAIPIGISAQEVQPPRIQLTEHERCNNWSRHYCSGDDHEDWVNGKLLEWKRQGRPITSRLVRKIAQQYTN